MDQSYKKFIGVKLIEAYPCEKDGAPGYNVKYPDGYESWSPQEQFEKAYLLLDGPGTTIMAATVDSFIAQIRPGKIDPKTTLVKCDSVTGFVQYETASCVDPNNYDEKLGTDIAMKKIKSELWFALGFILQWAKYGLKQVPKQNQGA